MKTSAEKVSFKGYYHRILLTNSTIRPLCPQGKNTGVIALNLPLAHGFVWWSEWRRLLQTRQKYIIIYFMVKRPGTSTQLLHWNLFQTKKALKGRVVIFKLLMEWLWKSLSVINASRHSFQFNFDKLVQVPRLATLTKVLLTWFVFSEHTGSSDLNINSFKVEQSCFVFHRYVQS